MSGTIKTADEFEPAHEDEEFALEDIELADGEAIRIASEQGPLLRYYVRVGDLFLQFERRRDDVHVSKANPHGIHYDESYYGGTRTEAGEAWEFVHGDYEVDTTTTCRSCGTEWRDGEKQCSCLSSVTSTTGEIPDVPVRSPRKVIGGELLAEPQ